MTIVLVLRPKGSTRTRARSDNRVRVPFHCVRLRNLSGNVGDMRASARGSIRTK